MLRKITGISNQRAGTQISKAVGDQAVDLSNVETVDLNVLDAIVQIFIGWHEPLPALH
jgi:hypothetical protein